MLSRVLVANRGEIALRVIRACREMGIETVAVHSEADRGSLYLDLADETVCIGPAECALSYLNIASIISAAEVTDADAIHPGYGFLAENIEFAQICGECGIHFVGPSVDAMKLLSDKVAARAAAQRAGVPVVPGSEGTMDSVEEALKLADKIGYPVIVKAVAGGGGRGMRVAHNDMSLRNGYSAAQAEAQAAFGNGTVYLEKFIEEPRHVEVQVMADKYGHAVHFFERDCSVQRRHQKMMEESPCPVLDHATRVKLCESALRLIRETKYFSAATVEFLLDKENNYYFIEANTRIQVEHPVSEMVTGQDLIKWQLRVAGGEAIDLKQDDIKLNGVAIECRVNAEDSTNNFVPCPGTIEQYMPPGGFGVRVDTHLHQGAVISPYYDSMIAKVIVHQPTREQAIATMQRALREFKISPIKTTIPACLDILSHNLFVKGEIDTGFIDRTF
jgi:acetyl-CoA carboxylase biotin carboxylase subunit